ncbi:MAG: ATP-dependent zinc metalloprotease FtsH [Anaerolineae bacterium]|nr:ATP-dependent zinc metalloprotease FtsH [Anaerolineae bacterium]MCX8066487.1 ATP-dependent zinc metalloprotease FtsH [Anaerolineae bacterium]MDW7990883.1 ATP-dependent zinc metalloprotease FtsH [Anaerolineae bacterium]
MMFLTYNLLSRSGEPNVVPISRIAAEVQAERVERIVVNGNRLEVRLKTGQQLRSIKEATATVAEQLKWLGVSEEQLAKVQIEVAEAPDWTALLSTGGTFLMMILFLVALFFFLRQFQGANNQALSFGKSRARLYTSDKPAVTFDDVAGVDEAKEELREIVEFLKEPQKFIQVGARIPKGVLLVGAPGTGKTLLAKAVAGEAGVPFFSMSGSEFVEMFVGVGASRVRDLFDQAKRHSPCIVFLDEIDAVGRHRGAGLGGSHDEREQTLNQILVEMDGFDTDTNVIVMAATNRPDILDPALLRPGRFDRRIVLDRPDVRGREAILRVHTRGKPLADDVDLTFLAKATPGFVGADLANVVNEAAILAARRNKKVIGMAEFKEAIERVLAGPERKSRIISEEERRIIAYHEAGHALVAHYLPKCDPVQKISIIARGMAAGYTLSLPEEDRTVISKSKFEDQLAFALGGRAAEELVFGEVTTGAANDLEQVTELARAMVTRYGMSEKLGPMTFGQKEELVFLGKEIGEQRDYSEAVAQQIDEEVRRIIHTAYQRARKVLEEHREQLDAVAQRLLEVETIEAEEFLAILEGRPLPERKQEEPKSPPPEPKKAEKPSPARRRALEMPPKPAPVQ